MLTLIFVILLPCRSPWCNSFYSLGSTEDGQVVFGISGRDVQSNEYWDCSESPHGGYFFTSREFNRQLGCNNETGLLYTVDQSFERSETWSLEPVSLPEGLSDRKLYALAGAGIAGVALTVAAPFAIVGAGAFLALESFAAAEVVIAGVGGGLLAGGAVVGSTAALVKNEKYRVRLGTIVNGDEKALEGNEGINRPLCAWRTW
jgi:hypothetical protein